ncbi:MAG TPA: TolC family protein [Blastocatellia bacterium]|nr:TolC family protein [Blastocatellia bacterium]
MNTITRRCFSAFLGFAFTATLSAVSVLAQTNSEQRKLSLDECVTQALNKHPLLEAAQARITGADEYKRFVGVRPNPSITIQTENWRAWQQPPFTFGTDIDVFVYGSQRIETAGKAARRTELANRQLNQTQTEIDTLKRQLRQEVIRRFWIALQNQTLLSIVHENRNDLDGLVQYNTTRLKEGFISEWELIRVRLEQQTLLNQEASVGLELERAKLDLLKSMGDVRFDTNFQLAEPNVAGSALLTTELEQLRTDALAKRPELVSMRAKVESERANLKLQQANARPDLEVSAGYKRTGGFNTALAYITIPLPVFNKNRAEIGRATAAITSAELQLMAEENYIRAEIEIAHRASRKLAERLNEMQKDFLQRADESRNIALVAYREGAADLYKLLEAQRARNEARLLYHRTELELQLALAELALAAGKENQP